MARVALAAVAALLVAAAPASASREQLSVFQDDSQLVLSGDDQRERTLDDLLALGVDTVHSIVFWNRIAPAPDAPHRPAGFDGSDPAAYPAARWDRYDGLVRGAVARGMDLILSPAGPIPRWASRCRAASPRSQRTCRPDVTQYKRFVQALATRYSGTYADENQGGATLPRVSRWSVWNEPNQGGWLTPQYVRVGGRLRLASPGIYRGLVRAATKGLRAAGHAHDDVLMGETAPIGRVTGAPSSRPAPPTDFWRALLCLDARGAKLTGAAAVAAACAPFGARLAITGVSHHPYTRGGSRPPTSGGNGTEITISSIARLKTILDAGARQGRIRSGLGIWYTEFGFQTNPPDTLFGVPPASQARWLNQSDWIAWHDPRVRSVAQYELRDEPLLASFQTGLEFADGRHKPGFDAYRLPLWVTRSGSRRVKIWGQVRPGDDGAAEVVDIQNDSGEGFHSVATATTTNAKGYVQVTVPTAPGTWRLVWTPAQGGDAVTSRTAKVER